MNVTENDNYKIVEETTFVFNGRAGLYIMLVQINDKFGVEINTRTSLVGRIVCQTRRLAEARHIQIETSLKKYSGFKSAISMLDLAFSMPSVKECLFLINHLNNPINFNALCKLKHIYGYKTTPINADLIFENRSYNYSIEITFPNSTIALGKFIAPDEDSAFTFEINSMYLNL